MADTIRTRSAVLALLPDNTAGEISPQDLRDFVVSTWGVHGDLAFENNAATASYNTTPTLLNLWSVTNSASGTTPSTASNQIAYNTTGIFLTNFTATCTNMNAATEFIFTLALNGSSITGARSSIRSTTGTDILIASITALIDVTSASDILTVLVESDDAGGQLMAVKNAQLTTYRVF